MTWNPQLWNSDSAFAQESGATARRFAEELETARRLSATAPSTEAWVEAQERLRVAEAKIAATDYQEANEIRLLLDDALTALQRGQVGSTRAIIQEAQDRLARL